MRWNAESNARYYTQIRYSVQLVRDCTAPQMAREYKQASRRLRWCQTISLTKLDTILSIPAVSEHLLIGLMALHQSATALHQPMLAFAGIERDRRGLGPFPLIKRYGDTPRSFSYAQLNHRQFVFAAKLSG